MIEITDPKELQRARDDVELCWFGVEDRNAGFDFEAERADLQASIAHRDCLL